MPGTNSKLSALEARKQLLVIESELHRAQLLHEWETLQLASQGLRQQVRRASSIISGVAAIFANVRTSLARKCSWLTTLMRGFRLGVTLWN